MTTATHITVRMPLAIRRRPGRKTVVTPVQEGGDASVTWRADPAQVKALARAHRWRRLLEQGRYASLSEMAAGERIDRGYLGRILQLALLAPDLVEAILDGRQPAELGLPALLDPLPAEWERQRNMLVAGEDPGRGPPIPGGSRGHQFFSAFQNTITCAANRPRTSARGT
jgi:hypothetical protein